MTEKSQSLFISILISLLFSGAIFGFFYAWVCSTIWGLNAIDPRVAIEAMQGMNASVRNAVFAPIFFATPFVVWFTALLAYKYSSRRAARFFVLAGVVYFFGGIVLTFSVNVPMNEALAEIPIPVDFEEAEIIWQAYSQKWQLWNITRTVFSGLSLLLVGAGAWYSAKDSI